MAASFGTDPDKRSVNVELNLVPFIDLMSCLTAFLLVTAVWINIARVDAKPRGRAVDGDGKPVKDPQLSILVDSDSIWIGESPGGTLQHIIGHDWTALTASLAAHKTGPVFVDRADVQLAAESADGKVVQYQDLIRAMDVAHRVGFVDVGLTDPKGLETRPML